jgi:hypothetical protein
MTLEQFLSEKKPAIMEKWFDLILDTYPADTTSFLKKQKDRFTNPVGHTIYEGLGKILDELIHGVDIERVSPFLDGILRVRAVQDFTASRAVSFIFSLKKVVWEEMKSDKNFAVPFDELRELDSHIDSLALASFDIFMKCREKLYDIKANELRNMTFRLVQRANAMGGEPDAESAPKGSNNDNA